MNPIDCKIATTKKFPYTYCLPFNSTIIFGENVCTASLMQHCLSAHPSINCQKILNQYASYSPIFSPLQMENGMETSIQSQQKI